MSDEITGSCFCGAVTISVSGAATAQGYCHCASCRSWSASPINAFTLWPAAAVKVTKGDEHLGAYAKTSLSLRKWCKACGGHLFTEHAPWGLVDVYAATIPGHRFEPGLHVNYADKTLGVPDGLPKFADLPSDFGGSGQTLPE